MLCGYSVCMQSCVRACVCTNNFGWQDLFLEVLTIKLPKHLCVEEMTRVLLTPLTQIDSRDGECGAEKDGRLFRR